MLTRQQLDDLDLPDGWTLSPEGGAIPPSAQRRMETARTATSEPEAVGITQALIAGTLRVGRNGIAESTRQPATFINPQATREHRRHLPTDEATRRERDRFMPIGTLDELLAAQQRLAERTEQEGAAPSIEEGLAGYIRRWHPFVGFWFESVDLEDHIGEIQVRCTVTPGIAQATLNAMGWSLPDIARALKEHFAPVLPSGVPYDVAVTLARVEEHRPRFGDA